MRLLIVSHTAHYRSGSTIVGWGPTVIEISHLAKLFEEIIHIGCFYEGPAPASALPYRTEDIRFIPVRPSGGGTSKDKLGVIRHLPEYINAIRPALPEVDAIHIRCPANISLVALLLLFFVQRPPVRWIKYAGNWRPDGREAWSYWLQRRLLRWNAPRGAVTVNGQWPDQPRHIHSFLNPCLEDEEIEHGRRAARGKQIAHPLNILYVGAVSSAKGAGRLLAIARRLCELGVPFEMHLVGGGKEQAVFEAQSQTDGLSAQVTFHGWLPKPKLADFYAQAHFLILPSETEGWPKAVSEAMAYGAVPITSAVSSLPQALSHSQAGMTVAIDDIAGYIQAIRDYAEHPADWKAASQAGITYAAQFTYAQYLGAVRHLFYDTWQIQLP